MLRHLDLELICKVRLCFRLRAELLAAGTGESDFGVVEGFGFDGGDGLRRRESSGEGEEQEEVKLFHHVVLVRAARND